MVPSISEISQPNHVHVSRNILWVRWSSLLAVSIVVSHVAIGAQFYQPFDSISYSRVGQASNNKSTTFCIINNLCRKSTVLVMWNTYLCRDVIMRRASQFELMRQHESDEHPICQGFFSFYCKLNDKILISLSMVVEMFRHQWLKEVE